MGKARPYMVVLFIGDGSFDTGPYKGQGKPASVAHGRKAGLSVP
jgi:hypothetical protein